MFRKLIQLALIVGVVGVGVHFTPDDIKQNATTKVSAILSQVIPNTVEEKIKDAVSPLIHTPIQRRAELLTKLRANIAKIKGELSGGTSASSETQTTLLEELEETEALIEKIENINKEQSIVNKVTATVFDTVKNALVGTEGGTNEVPNNTPTPTTPPPLQTCSWSCTVE